MARAGDFRFAAAAKVSRGTPSVLMKSPPVPAGTMPNAAAGATAASPSKNPLTTSLMVPSPPTATTRSAPPRKASRVSLVASPADCVKRSSKVPYASWMVARSSGQRRSVLPPADCGLMTSTVPGMARLYLFRRRVGEQLDQVDRFDVVALQLPFARRTRGHHRAHVGLA